jgi:hypothetical protein
MLTPEQIEQVALTCLPCGGKGYTAELVWMKKAITLALEMNGADILARFLDGPDGVDPDHGGFVRLRSPQGAEAESDVSIRSVIGLLRSISDKEQQMTLDITGIKNSLSDLENKVVAVQTQLDTQTTGVASLQTSLDNEIKSLNAYIAELQQQIAGGAGISQEDLDGIATRVATLGTNVGTDLSTLQTNADSFSAEQAELDAETGTVNLGTPTSSPATKAGVVWSPTLGAFVFPDGSVYSPPGSLKLTGVMATSMQPGAVWNVTIGGYVNPDGSVYYAFGTAGVTSAGPSPVPAVAPEQTPATGSQTISPSGAVVHGQ